MDFCCFSRSESNSWFPLLPSGIVIHRRPIPFRLRPLVAAGGGVKCEFGGSIAPLGPRSSAGRYLNGVLLDDRDVFPAAARKELERLAVERDEAVARSQLSRGSDVASLHRRIAELKKHECQTAVEDILYAYILHKFYEIHVYLVPKLSKCICNSRLEIWPSKDWELESIHGTEVLEMVREHISSIIGCRPNSCIRESWATIDIQQACLSKLYIASILFGYFLKSASLRHQLDLSNRTCSHVLPISLGLQYVAFGRVLARPKHGVLCGVDRKCESLRCYVMGFDQETVQMCAEPKSEVAMSLIERQSRALFGDLGSGLAITTSFGSVKRLMLEGVAFGCFLWDAEEWLNDVENLV